MAETRTEPSPDPAAGSGALFAAYRELVRPEWIDFNGHLHDASYATVFADAHELLFEDLGLSADYRTSHDAAMFTVETHIRFLAECSAGQTLTATTTLVDADAKRVLLHSELYADGVLAATGESLYLHVDTASGRTAAFPADRQVRVDTMLTAHASLPRPAHLGLGVGVRP